MAAAAELTDPPSSSMAFVLSMAGLNHSSAHKATIVKRVPATLQAMAEGNGYSERFASAQAAAGISLQSRAERIGVTYRPCKALQVGVYKKRPVAKFVELQLRRRLNYGSIATHPKATPVGGGAEARMTTAKTSALHPLLRDLYRTLGLVAACVVAVHLLAGCGGGGDEPDVPLPTVSCTAGVCK